MSAVPQNRPQVQLVRAPDGRVFLVVATRPPYMLWVSGAGQLAALQQLYGPALTLPQDRWAASFAGLEVRGEAVHYFNTLMGVERGGLELLVANPDWSPFAPAPGNEPVSGVKVPAGERPPPAPMQPGVAGKDPAKAREGMPPPGGAKKPVDPRMPPAMRRVVEPGQQTPGLAEQAETGQAYDRTPTFFTNVGFGDQTAPNTTPGAVPSEAQFAAIREMGVPDWAIDAALGRRAPGDAVLFDVFPTVEQLADDPSLAGSFFRLTPQQAKALSGLRG